MSYIKRKTESNIKQFFAEKLQGGFIFRFNETISQKDNMNGEIIINYNYDEYFFNKLPTVSEVEVITNSILNNTQSLFIINETIIEPSIPVAPVLTLNKLKIKKIAEFDLILNDFTLLITRAKLISGESIELNNIIEIIKGVKDTTINSINNFLTIEELSKFNFKKEDINGLKLLLKPFLF